MKITIRWWNGSEFADREMDAVPCGVPGLAIHAAPDADGWVITHIASGCRAAWFPDASPEWVLACAQELGTLGDWTASPLPLRLPARAVLDKYGGDWASQPAVSPGALRAERARIRALTVTP